ncbi:MAG TPA: DUF4339 domain-containing protein [Bacillota bacterium]|nr:DUF4339 domain-containing protein [Bacillota bacterium]
MFRIIGIDRKEYGPVTEDQIRQWLKEGRANAHTQVQREGAENWERLGEMPEFTTGFRLPGGQWTCLKCGEQIEPQFDSCWCCSSPKPGRTAVSTQPNPPPMPPCPAKESWRAEYRIFRGTLTTWEELFDQASEFASDIGRERLISISHSADRSDGVVTVWYWTREADTVS